MERRSFLRALPLACLGGSSFGYWPMFSTDNSTLKSAMSATGRIVGCFSTFHQLASDPLLSSVIAKEFGLLADGNDLKMDHLRPSPYSFSFAAGDAALEFAKQHKMLMRGHTLVWHNALPFWFSPYVNKYNAARIMTEHISKTVKHFSGKLYSWDVVNEMIHTQDGRRDGLREKPWLELVGPDYIEIALRAAAEADPSAKLVINENNIEHDIPIHKQRRVALLGLCRKLKTDGVPLHAVGIQSHIKGGVPFAVKDLNYMLAQLRDMGLDIFITELDVDDTALPSRTLASLVAQTYVQYLAIVAPFAKMICFEQLRDVPMIGYPQIEQRRTDHEPHRPNLFDVDCNKKASYFAVRRLLESLTAIKR